MVSDVVWLEDFVVAVDVLGEVERQWKQRVIYIAVAAVTQPCDVAMAYDEQVRLWQT